jgi:hypothetical protein
MGTGKIKEGCMKELFWAVNKTLILYSHQPLYYEREKNRANEIS